jgi:hypothetical protein
MIPSICQKIIRFPDKIKRKVGFMSESYRDSSKGLDREMQQFIPHGAGGAIRAKSSLLT